MISSEADGITSTANPPRAASWLQEAGSWPSALWASFPDGGGKTGHSESGR